MAEESLVLPEPLRLRVRPWRKIGIVLAGLVVALVLAGQVIFLVNAAHSGLSLGGDKVAMPSHGGIKSRLSPVLSSVLGPSDRGVPRYALTVTRTPASRLSNLRIRWAINNDLSAGSVGNGAQVDVYAMLRAIYTSSLPVASVSLIGTYPISGREAVAMRLRMSRSDAARVAAYGWDNLDAQALWPLVQRVYVYPALVPLTNQ